MKQFILSALLILFGMTLQAQDPKKISTLHTQEYLLKTWDQDQQKNQGYVWTITIHSGTEIIVEDLMEATYAMHLSMSHVGPTMNGVYKGVMGISAARDTEGFQELLNVLGGKLTTNGDISEMDSNVYTFVLNPFSAASNDSWQHYFGYDALSYGMTGAAKEMMDDLVKSFFGTYVRRSKPFETTMQPVSFGYRFNLPIGSSGSLQKARIDIKNGFFSTHVSAEVDLGDDDEKKKRRDRHQGRL